MTEKNVWSATIGPSIMGLNFKIISVMVVLIWQCCVLKLDSHLPNKFFLICINYSLSKMMKIAFYFILKALFVLKIFRFLSLPFGHVEKTAWL